MSTQPSSASSDTKRKYSRRSEAERIQALQQKLETIKQKLEEKNKKHEISPAVKQIPRLQKKLKKYAQFAEENGRSDLATSVLAFVAGLDRIYHSDMAAHEEASGNVALDRDFDSFGD